MAFLQTVWTKTRTGYSFWDAESSATPPFPLPDLFWELLMHIALTPDQERLRDELREYFAALVTPEVKAGLAAATGEFGDDAVYKKVIRQLGSDGWLGIGWPKEYGGQARSMIEQLIFTDVAAIAGVPIPYLTLNTVGPTIMRYGTDEQKDYFLPRILKGELHFSIGYSEPGSGTDLASLKTKAVREGDEWVINGQKMWTSLIQYADWLWMAVRTDPDLPRHKGLSMILVPADSPGFSYTPVHTVAGVSTSATYYEDVRVPASNLVGELNGGWSLMTNQLNHERVALTSAAPLTYSIDMVRRWAQETKNPDGQRVIDSEWVQIALGRAHARTTALALINWKLAADADAGVDLSPAEASATKIYGSELATEVYRSLMEIVGPNAGITGDSEGAVLAGRLERFYRSALVMTFGGGTNEIQRDIIGYVGLGLPAAKRS
ncbi:acyl-CoA dehydrogenase family protein [Nocardioides conyzicola]|uniref:Acyl-CoA dehydrogenase family protein n=1 Tax=Nocardioides conyzicola TaxID=1651781 RepID=A0ABP8XYJ9_9ACTN